MVTKKVIFSSLIIAVVYVIFTVLMMNGRLVQETIPGNFPLDYKFNLMIALLAGMWTAMTGAGLFILFITAILTGINLTLVFQRLSLLQSSGKLHIMVGGSSVLGIVGSGCAACGLPVLALLGLSGSVAYLPFQGTELSIISVVMLSISLYLMVKSNSQSKVCQLEVRSQIA
jgi:hypothetical protein